MYNFQEHLHEGEKILYEGRPIPGKGGKQIGVFIFLICFSLFVEFLLVWSVITKTGDGANGIDIGFILIFLTAMLFLCLGIYGLINDLFLKKIRVADDFYCLTNIRAMKYEAKKNKLVFGYLEYYEDIHCSNVTGNYGDLYMGIVMEEENNDSAIETLVNIKDRLINPNPENMPIIIFESIKNPSKIMKLAKEARININ